MSESERAACLVRAGFNVVNLDAADVQVDLASDVPLRFSLERTPGELREPPLQELLAATYGAARYVPFVKGRSAEFAFVAAFAENRSPTVLTHGLFRSTERQLTRHNARIEVIPRRGDGTCNPDVELLAKRLAAGGVDMVYLEPSNNGWGGLPLYTETVRQVRRACSQHDAILVLDATRVFANCASQGVPAAGLVAAVHELTREAHGFTVSCAKEHFVSVGGFAALPDLERQRRAYFQGLINGTLLEAFELRSDLAQGIAHLTKHPEELVARRERLLALANRLKHSGIECLDPPGGHAVFVVVDPWVNGALQARSFEAHLYRVGGVRAQVSFYPLLQKHVLRLALPLRSYGVEQLAHAALGLRAAIDRVDEAYQLAEAPADHVHDSLARYAVEDGTSAPAGEVSA